MGCLVWVRTATKKEIWVHDNTEEKERKTSLTKHAVKVSKGYFASDYSWSTEVCVYQCGHADGRKVISDWNKGWLCKVNVKADGWTQQHHF